VNCEFAQCRSLSHHNTAVCLKHVCTHTDQRTIRRTKVTLLIDNNDNEKGNRSLIWLF